MIQRTLFVALFATLTLANTGCVAWQSANVDSRGGMQVEGFNGVLGNPGLPFGPYDVYWEPGTWHYDNAGIARQN